MDAITVLGLLSLAFVAVFTAAQYRKGNGGGQTPRGAIIEAWLNILIGFSINYAINLLLLPMVGAQLTASSNFWLGWVYTAVSIIRQYALRRWFNARLHAAATRPWCRDRMAWLRTEIERLRGLEHGYARLHDMHGEAGVMRKRLACQAELDHLRGDL
jgi:hypothetical protein